MGRQQNPSPRGVLIAGNWKMNHGQSATVKFIQELKERATSAVPGSAMPLFHEGKLRACIIPPALSLPKAIEMSKIVPFPLEVAAQNAHWEKSGAFTGELSGPALAELGLSWVLIGHSERRQYFGETDETVRKRTESLLQQNFKVIACIGETRAEREAGRTREVLTRQLQGIFPDPKAGASAYLDGRLVIAYEPVWAIGTGLTATPEQAQEAHATVRAFLAERIDSSAAARTQILYGGSVTPENVDSLLACPDVDGALVGGASLKPESYLALLLAGVRRISG